MVVPRDMIYHMCGVDGGGSTYTPVNMYKNGPSVVNASGGNNAFHYRGWSNHEAQAEVNVGTSGTTLTSSMNWCIGGYIPAGHNCSSRISAYISTTTGIIAWVSLFDSGLAALTNVAGNPDIGYAAGVPMIALRYYPDAPANDTTWKLYICDGANPGQVIDTGVAPTVADPGGRVPAQTFDAWYTPDNVLTVAIDGVVVANAISPTHTLINAPAIYLFGQNRGLSNTLLVQNTTATPVSAGWAFGYIGVDSDKS